MVLRDNLHGEMILLDINIGIIAHGFHQSTLYLRARVVGMMQNAELRMSSLAMQVIFPVLLLVEMHAPVHQLLNLLWSAFHHLLHCSAVADIVSRYHSVFYMLLEVIHFKIGHRSYTALGKRSVGFIQLGLAYHAHFTFVRSGYFQGVTHTGHTCADNQEIVFVNHRLVFNNYAKVTINP